VERNTKRNTKSKELQKVLQHIIMAIVVFVITNVITTIAICYNCINLVQKSETIGKETHESFNVYVNT